MRGGIRGCGTGADELRIIRATRSLAITIKRIALRVETILLEILVRPRMTRLRAIRRAVLIRARPGWQVKCPYGKLIGEQVGPVGGHQYPCRTVDF